MFELLTGNARHVIGFAQEEAAFVLRHNHMGTEHVLVGLLREEQGVAASVLESLGVDLDSIRAEIVALMGRGTREVAGHRTVSEALKNCLRQARSEAVSLGHKYIGTEHLLLAVASDTDTTAARALREVGANPKSVRDAVHRELSSPHSQREKLGADDY